MTYYYDVVVAYRIYPKVSKTPPIFQHDKYALSRLCLQSFKKSLGTLKVKVFALLDQCPPNYQALFREFFCREDLELIELEGIGNQETFALQVKILSEQKDAPVVYFAEDDYFYLPDEFHTMVSFLTETRIKPVHFVSPYDHLDFYTLDLHQHPVSLGVAHNRHWKTSNSTCMTFLTTKQILLETKSTLLTYAKGNFDASMWLSLTKCQLFNPLNLLKYYRTNKFLFEVLKYSWLYDWKQILLGKTWKLWTPVPSIATHMDSDYLAPAIDWEREIDQVITEDFKQLSQSSFTE